MQFLWKYIDDLVGKGLEFKLVIQLVGLYSITILPLALPLSILLSSTMVLGGMGEHNELVAFKSSGVSLMRIMGSLIIFVFFISLGTYLFSNSILPSIHLKFYSLLYDIRKHKPALDIKEGLFYNGIENYTLRVMGKDDERNVIEDITLYDHSNSRGNMNITMAESGQLISSADGNYLILTLYNGKQYREIEPKTGTPKLHEMNFMSFDTYRKVFDLSSFKLRRTDQALFKDHYHMLSSNQLQSQIDTLEKEMIMRFNSMKDYRDSYYQSVLSRVDSTTIDSSIIIASYDFSEYLNHRKDTLPYAIKANTLVKIESVKANADATFRDNELKDYMLARHKMEWHRKLTSSIICLILLFIGGSMGAIIRKGGFGMPMLIAVLFFLLLHVLNITGEKLSKEMVLVPEFGMWISVIVLSVIAIFVTYKAVNDSRFMREGVVNYYFLKLKRLPIFKKYTN
jgi:lipopolysaccharide export system permease protein